MTAPDRRDGGPDDEDGRLSEAVANLLAFEVPARGAVPRGKGDAGVAKHLRAVLLGRVLDRDRHREEREHRGEDRPRLPHRADHAAEHEDQTERDQELEEELEVAGERRRALERDGRVRVVEAAAVRAEVLDGDLRRDRATRDQLLAALERRRRRVPREGLHDALRHEHERGDEREREEDVGDRSIEVDPEVAERLRGAAREAADHGDQDGHPDSGRDEVLHGEPGHLAQVRHRRLAGVELPVRVRQEARGRVRGDTREQRP